MSTFWNGYMLHDFIFQGLNTNSVAGFIGIVVALISAGVLYEGLNLLKNKSLQKFFNLRRELIRDQLQERQSSQDDQPNPTTTHNTSSVDLNPQEELPEDVVDDNVNPRNSLINDELYNEIRAGISRLTATQRFTQGHGLIYLFTSSTLHAVYAFSGYTLMNAVMTFNTWILIAVCLGMGIGSLIFRAGTITLPFIENDFQQTQSVEAYAQFTSNEKTDDNIMSSYQANEDLPSALPIGRRRDFCKDELEENNSQVDDVGAQVMVVGAQVHHDYQQSI